MLGVSCCCGEADEAIEQSGVIKLGAHFVWRGESNLLPNFAGRHFEGFRTKKCIETEDITHSIDHPCR